MENKTPLYDTHVKYGGTMVPFGGYILPVQYETGIRKEHMAVREDCGLFDVSHMGEITVKGADSLAFLNYLLTNDFTDLEPGVARYSPMCYEDGGTVDDLIVYMRDENDYLLVVNAANKDKDFKWICDNKKGEVEIEDVSDGYGQVALQGPKAEKILSKVAGASSIPEKYYTCIFGGEIKGIPCMISRTGYTGEDGFEIYMPAENAPDIWEILIEAGKEDGLIPCGLGARDTLRIEAGMPLYGHELTAEINPKMAALGFAVKLDKDDFIGKSGIEASLPLKKSRVGLKAIGRGVLREECDVYKDGEKIGVTTSGTFLPYLNGSYAIAMVDKDKKNFGDEAEVEVRGRRIKVEMVKMPFYKRQ